MARRIWSRDPSKTTMSPGSSLVFSDGFDSVIPALVQAMTEAPVRGRSESLESSFPAAGESSSIRQVSTSTSLRVPPRR